MQYFFADSQVVCSTNLVRLFETIYLNFIYNFYSSTIINLSNEIISIFMYFFTTISALQNLLVYNIVFLVYV